jgi:hypothetical protein
VERVNFASAVAALPWPSKRLVALLSNNTP